MIVPEQADAAIINGGECDRAAGAGGRPAVRVAGSPAGPAGSRVYDLAGGHGTAIATPEIAAV